MSVHPSNLRERQVPVSDRIDVTFPRSRPTNTCRYAFQIILIFVVFIAIIFGIIMIIYVIRWDSVSKTIVVKEDSDEEKKRNEYEKTLFDNCIDVLWENLLRLNFNRNNPEHLQPIRIKVLNTLRHLNSTYKRDLILFLYEHELIRTDIPSEQRLNLHGADLKDVQFENLNLDYLYLPGVIASNSLFNKCQLKKSNFQGNIMDNSRFSACSLEESTFSGASLKQSSFTNDNILSGINFTNTDLFDSHININDSRNKNILLNTRLPDGSFFNIDSKGLIKDGGAEEQCNTSQTDHWWIESGYSPLKIDRRQNSSCITMKPIRNNNCYFQAKSTSRFIQNIDLTRYSTLIDNNQAWFNISAYLGCFNTSSTHWAMVEVCFANERENYGNLSTYVLKDKKSWRLLSNNSSVPFGTRTVKITIGANMGKPSKDSPRCCAIDDVNFNIFQKK